MRIRDMAGEGHVEVNLADEEPPVCEKACHARNRGMLFTQVCRVRMKERVGSATPGCINFRVLDGIWIGLNPALSSQLQYRGSRWAAAAAAAATALLFVGALQAKSAFSSPIVARSLAAGVVPGL